MGQAAVEEGVGGLGSTVNIICNEDTAGFGGLLMRNDGAYDFSLTRPAYDGQTHLRRVNLSSFQGRGDHKTTRVFQQPHCATLTILIRHEGAG